MSVISGAAKAGKVISVFFKNHKATICVCSGVVAGGAAVVECGHATYKSVKKIDEMNAERISNGEEPLTKKEVIKECVTTYIPTIGLATISAGLILYGHKLTLKQLSIATASAKLVETEYKQLRDSIEEVLSTDERKDIKDAVLDRFAEKKVKVYGDSKHPVDVYDAPTYTRGVPLCNFNKCNQLERFKDKYGAEFMATRADIRYAVSELHSQMKDSQSYEPLDTFYRLVTDEPSRTEMGDMFIWEPENLRDVNDIDVRLEPSYDADGLYWQMYYTEEPTCIN